VNSGVTPIELYMRQNGTCYLEITDAENPGEFRLYCTDGVDRAVTESLANPTTECSACMTKFILTLFVGRGVSEE